MAKDCMNRRDFTFQWLLEFYLLHIGRYQLYVWYFCRGIYLIKFIEGVIRTYIFYLIVKLL